MHCKKHPKYKGLTKPKHECEECLSLYFKYNGNRPERIKTAKPSKIEKSQKIYNRKNKHKKKIH